jgi:hypothetical protein
LSKIEFQTTNSDFKTDSFSNEITLQSVTSEPIYSTEVFHDSTLNYKSDSSKKPHQTTQECLESTSLIDESTLGELSSINSSTQMTSLEPFSDTVSPNTFNYETYHLDLSSDSPLIENESTEFDSIFTSSSSSFNFTTTTLSSNSTTTSNNASISLLKRLKLKLKFNIDFKLYLKDKKN